MPRVLVSLRLDTDLRRRLAAAARRRDRTPSELARSAIEFWLEHEESRARAEPGEALAELVGCVAGGARDRSTSRDIARLSSARPTRRLARSGSKRKK